MTDDHLFKGLCLKDIIFGHSFNERGKCHRLTWLNVFASFDHYDNFMLFMVNKRRVLTLFIVMFLSNYTVHCTNNVPHKTKRKAL